MKISIIVPVYMVEKEIRRCIESLINQTYKDIEIILVDDGSHDNCPMICDEYSKNDNRIRVIHKQNGGLSDARNVGIREATGEYFLLIDGDDYIEHDTCECFVKVIQDEKPDIVVADYIEEREGKQFIHTHTSLKSEKTYSAEQYIVNTLEKNELKMEACFNLYNLNFWRKKKFEYKKGIYHEDMQLTPKVILSAERIKYLNKSFYHYVIRQGSIMNQNNRKKRYEDVMNIYFEWSVLANQIEINKMRRLFRGFLNKCFIRSCVELNVKEPDFSIISKKNLIVYSLNLEEFIRAICFVFMRDIYYFIFNLKYR